jgi:tRNA threonylcarbamoyladenosine biosynthesis protein TsaB
VSALVVALETSSRSPTVAVRAGDAMLEARLESARAHASDLVPALDRMLKELGATAAEITAVLVGTGPGSYTGLRVGIATALGIARGCCAALRGVPSGETLCYGELEPGEEAVVLLDARAGEIYFAHYRRREDEVEVLRPPCVLRPDEVATALPETVSIFGDETAARAAGLVSSARARIRAPALPRAQALLALGSLRLERLGAHAPSEVVPLYLRPFAVRQGRR